MASTFNFKNGKIIKRQFIFQVFDRKPEVDGASFNPFFIYQGKPEKSVEKYWLIIYLSKICIFFDNLFFFGCKRTFMKRYFFANLYRTLLVGFPFYFEKTVAGCFI